MKKWYEVLFENYANKYDAEVFVQGTLGECDFFEKEFEYNKNLKILDLGCGTGRHSIELAKRGYNITGIDLSDNLLERARKKAEQQGVKVDFQRQDARAISFENEFDAIIMICEGGFSLMETDEMNFQILKNAAKALKQGGRLIFTTLNGLFPLRNSVEDFCSSQTQEGNAVYSNNSFDFITMRDSNITVIEDDDGNKRELECNERYYIPSEITWLLKTLNFNKIDIFGAKLGAFSRQDILTFNDFEMLVIAEKFRS